MNKTTFLLLSGLVASCAHGQPSQNNDPNTITYSKGGKTYRLTAVGDRVPRFYVNDQRIEREELENFDPLFTDLQNQLEERKRKTAQKTRILTEKNQASLVADLVRDKIIGTPSELHSFQLDGNHFTVNGRKQSFALFTRYKDKYLAGVNYILQFN